ncbi:MAG: MFS transporter, partial [Candidatus Bipolaricaulota bacterium]
MDKENSIFKLLEEKFSSDRWYYSYSLANLAAGGVSILIPLYVLHLGGEVSDIGLLTAAGNLVGIAASLTWGALSDRWNRRKLFVVIGFLGVGLSFILMSIVETFSLLLLLNSTYILFWMSAASVATILIIEKESRGDWDHKIASFNFSSGLGWTLGLAIGFAWASLSGMVLAEELALRSLFVILGISGLVGGVCAVRWIPGEVKFDRSKFRGRLVEAGDLITERFRYLPIHLYYLLNPTKLLNTADKLGPELSAFLVAVGLTFSGFSIFFIPLPAYFKSVIGVGDGTIYILFIANALSGTLFYRPAAKLTKKVGPRKVLPVSLVLRIVLFPLIVVPFAAIDGSFLQLLATAGIFVAIGTTWAFINVSNLVIVSNLTEGRIKGQIFGIYNSINGASLVIGSLIGGYLAKFSGYLATFLLASLFIALGLSIIRGVNYTAPRCGACRKTNLTTDFVLLQKKTQHSNE